MPSWVLRELNHLVFQFFYNDKPDLVTRDVIVQPPSCGGFSVVNVQLKVWALLLQWVRRFSLSPLSWASLFSFWCNQGFRASPVQILSNPLRFPGAGGLPGFYLALLTAWRSANGAFLPYRGSLCVGSGLTVMPVTSLSTKSAYLMLLSDRSAIPHCVVKFFIPFGPLYWPATWRQLFFFDMHRQVIDLSWKVAHGVLYTAGRLSSFGYAIPTACFCGHCWRLWTICFSLVLWLIVSFLGCLLCFFFFRHPLVLSFSVMFGLVSRRMSFCVSLASLFMLLMSANSPSGWPGMISGFVMFVRVPLLSWSGLSLASGSTYLCSSAVLSLPVVSVILLRSGVPMVLLAQSVMAVWFCRSSFIFC